MSEFSDTDTQPAVYAFPAGNEEGATNTIIHEKCQKPTTLHPTLAAAHRKDSEQFMNLPCHHCGGQHPASQFKWEGEHVKTPSR